jgi:PHD/YefM family antitoxin component YafN of YafNO toxin-antitoxin module
MLIPNANYVVDGQGQKVFVQVTVEDWEKLLAEIQRLENLLRFKENLKHAFKEVRQIKQGKKIGIPLSQLIDEL